MWSTPKPLPLTLVQLKSVFRFLAAANFMLNARIQLFRIFLCAVLQICRAVQYCIWMFQALKSNLSTAFINYHLCLVSALLLYLLCLVSKLFCSWIKANLIWLAVSDYTNIRSSTTKNCLFLLKLRLLCQPLGFAPEMAGNFSWFRCAECCWWEPKARNSVVQLWAWKKCNILTIISNSKQWGAITKVLSL